MQKRGDEVHIDDTEASGGQKTGHVRWILGIGTLLAIVLLSIVWITGSMTQGDVEEERTASGRIDSSVGNEIDGDQTDGIVSDDADQIETPITDGDT
ncbi:MAG: hypothetical protein WA908_06470 [Pontixanthobacter sp.]